MQSSHFMKITLLDAKELNFPPKDNLAVSELSALALNGENLYALSDKGYLYHFKIKIKNDHIKTLKLKKAFVLQNEKHKRLKKKYRDAEGLVFVDNKLLISFERKPRVELYSLDGIKIKNKKIHKDLRDLKLYKSENKALEALAYNEKYGIVTTPEKPLKNKNKKFHRLYTKENIYKFKASGGVSALEFIDDDTLMVLERKFNGLSFQRVITLSKVFLDNCKKNLCKEEILAIFDSSDGWNVDNFEGLTKVGKNRYLMVSDDNDSLLQKTLLVLFKI